MVSHANYLLWSHLLNSACSFYLPILAVTTNLFLLPTNVCCLRLAAFSVDYSLNGLWVQFRRNQSLLSPPALLAVHLNNQGCGCDIAGHWYSLSTDLNPHWKTRYPTQPEIREYWDGLWRKYNLDRYTKLKTEVSFAQWHPSRQIYEVSLQDRDGLTTKVEANIIIFATGGFGEPKYPPGLELDKFKGELFHAARWSHNVDLKGKTVGVIGNGCSA